MFSSCPVSAFVAGEKRGGSNRSLSTSPAGSSSPASVPLDRYSFAHHVRGWFQRQGDVGIARDHQFLGFLGAAVQ